MITDFPDVKKELKKFAEIFLRQKFKEKTTLFSLGKKKSLFEGDKMGVLRENGHHSVHDMQSAQSEFSISKRDIPKMEAKDFIDKFTTMAEDIAAQVERGLLHRLDEAIAENGNVLTFTSGLDPEFILNGLERIVIDFEDDDRMKPIKPVLLAGPDMIEKLKDRMSKATPEEKDAFRQREEMILDKKHNDHLKDLESRKLVD